MWQDPIVEEVRTTREKLAAKWAQDPVGYRLHQRQLLKRWNGRIVSKTQLNKERAAAAAR